MNIRAVVFDFYGTLSPGRSDEAQRRARHAQATALGVSAADFDAAMTATVDERFRGAGGDVAGSLRWITTRLNADVPPPAVERAAAVRLAAERSFGEPRPDAVEVLSTLRVLHWELHASWLQPATELLLISGPLRAELPASEQAAGRLPHLPHLHDQLLQELPANLPGHLLSESGRCCH